MMVPDPHTRLILEMTLATLLAALGLYMRHRRRRRRSETRPVTARVLESGRRNESEGFTAYVRYRYTVDGQTYVSERVWPDGHHNFNADTSFPTTRLKRFLARFPRDRLITARYWPDAPECAYLLDGDGAITYIPCGFAVLLIVLAVYQLWPGLFADLYHQWIAPWTG